MEEGAGATLADRQPQAAVMARAREAAIRLLLKVPLAKGVLADRGHLVALA